MGEKLAVDEQMVPFKGKNRLKQYLPGKPKKWGYKIFILAGSDGVPHNFEVYKGKAVQPVDLQDIGVSGNIVLRLSQRVPTPLNYKIFFDNWFTSVSLIKTLAQQGIHCTGTVRSNRLPGVNLKDIRCWKRNHLVCSEVTVTSVSLLSNYIGAHPVTEVDRWDGKNKKMIKVPCPAVVREYNKNMGGVDLLDSLTALYRTKIRSKKWYHRLMLHIIDMITVTAWLFYKRDSNNTGMKKEEQIQVVYCRKLV
ncbi:piggyBac transposable element-derived protein 3-like [Poecilia formosa]|uniref:piggyBac transposable element-derived protein 3-like n=1 Tax=Poecilia formosa TaxID=48698 RepID=UPI0007B835B5|nr:PREDICTED: piggyBac transposable element-derived protein 3-like [Poecilia formosa]